MISTSLSLANPFKTTTLSLYLLFSCVCVAFSNPIDAATSVELGELGFFEGTRDATVPDWGSPQIKTSFDKSKTRNIFTLMQVKNKLFNQQDQVIKIDVRYLRSDGSPFGERTIETHLPKDWETIELWTGWGWDTGNRWDPGFYRVELWLQNDTKLGEGIFQIKAGTGTVTRTDKIEFDQMGFYEGGVNDIDHAPRDWSDNRIRNRFAKSEARYIYTMVSLNNLLWNIKDQHVSINVRYYHSDGKLFGDLLIESTIPKEWKISKFWNGLGFTDPGHWMQDRYRVELWLDNKKKIGEGFFTIY